jgi:hypothetical protein
MNLFALREVKWGQDDQFPARLRVQIKTALLVLSAPVGVKSSLLGQAFPRSERPFIAEAMERLMELGVVRAVTKGRQTRYLPITVDPVVMKRLKDALR